MGEEVHTLYNLRHRRVQSEANKRTRGEWDRFKTADVETPLVNYEPPDVSAALHEVMSWCVYHQRTDLRQLDGFENVFGA